MSEAPIGRLDIEIAPSTDSNHGVCLVFQIVNDQGKVLQEQGRSPTIKSPSCVYQALMAHFAGHDDATRDVLVSNLGHYALAKIQQNAGLILIPRG